jgi:hypothetical protein
VEPYSAFLASIRVKIAAALLFCENLKKMLGIGRNT